MERYSRQLLLPEIGEDGQKRIAAGKVLIVGAGGLGSPVALYLAAAGVGSLGIADDDIVSESNLQRQILYREEDLGKKKALVAALRAGGLNSNVEVVPYEFRLDSSNAANIVEMYDIVVDCSDNFPTRYMLDSICREKKKIYVYGAIEGFVGQVSVFDAGYGTGSYTDLYPEPADNPSLGVVGMSAAVVGGVMAHETIKILCGYGEVLRNKLWGIDLRTMQSYIIDL